MSLKTVWSWVYPVLIGVVIALVLRRYVVSAAIVPSSSMRPMIPNPCYIAVNKLAAEAGHLHRGEVVVFHWPDDPSQIFVKRIVGMPGDTVTVTNNAVYVNGQKYVVPDAIQPNLKGLGTYHVPAGHYFMMGDNRPVSKDSRLWHNKYVARSAILGEAQFVIFPFNKIHGIS